MGCVCAPGNQFEGTLCCSPRGEPNILQILFLRLKDDDDVLHSPSSGHGPEGGQQNYLQQGNRIKGGLVRDVSKPAEFQGTPALEGCDCSDGDETLSLEQG